MLTHGEGSTNSLQPSGDVFKGFACIYGHPYLETSDLDEAADKFDRLQSY